MLKKEKNRYVRFVGVVDEKTFKDRLLSFLGEDEYANAKFSIIETHKNELIVKTTHRHVVKVKFIGVLLGLDPVKTSGTLKRVVK